MVFGICYPPAIIVFGNINNGGYSAATSFSASERQAVLKHDSGASVFLRVSKHTEVFQSSVAFGSKQTGGSRISTVLMFPNT